MMKFKHFAGIGATTLLTMGLAVPAVAQSANAALKDTNGQDVGTVSLSQTAAGVLLKLSLKGLPPGEPRRRRCDCRNSRRDRSCNRPCRRGSPQRCRLMERRIGLAFVERDRRIEHLEFERAGRRHV